MGAEEEQGVAVQESTKAGGGDKEGYPHPKENNFHQNESQEAQASGTSTSSPLPSVVGNSPIIVKGKSCKGCLYYSSTRRANSRNPLCVGLTRPLPRGTEHIVICYYSF